MITPAVSSNFLNLSVFQSIPGNIALLLPDAPVYTIIATTDGYLRISGRSKEELIGKGLFEAFPNPPDDPNLTSEKRLRASLEHTVKLKEPHRLPLHRYDIYTADGFFDERYWSAVNKPVLNEAGEIIYILHCAEDITVQIIAEQREQQLTKVETQHQGLRTAYSRLQESEEKYRTLFNSIDQGFCVIEVLFDENNNPSDYRFLEINPMFAVQTGLKDAAGKRMREMVPNHDAHWFEIYGKVALTGEAIRFVERSESLGRWFDVFAFRIGDPQNRRVALLFTDITERKNAELSLIEKDRNLRNIIHHAPVAMLIFRGEFYNLVHNALKFSKAGEPPVINIKCRIISEQEINTLTELDQNSRYYQIDVQDNGIGFNQEVADKIFIMFQRLHSNDTYAGTGIGLALCKKVVQNHGGKIWAEGREGGGASFRIVLPVG
jgi:PAS domain S-box-containing protein